MKIAAPMSLIALAGASMLIGADSANWRDCAAVLAGRSTDARLATLLHEVRLPRMVAGLLAGAALGAAGMLMQTMTRNRLADPGLLGVNAGAALGVVSGIAMGAVSAGPGYLLWAGAGALLGNACVLAIGHLRRGPDSPLQLVLAGVALSATFQGLSAAILLAQPSAFDQYRFWALGSLSGITLAMTGWAAPAVTAGLVAAFLLARPLSSLLLGDDAARSIGHRPLLLRALVAACVAVLTGSAVALAGPIAFLGLLAPFLARAAAGPSLRAQTVMATWMGAGLLLAADMAARLVAQPYETPISVLTAVAGAPLLIWLARSGRGAIA